MGLIERLREMAAAMPDEPAPTFPARGDVLGLALTGLAYMGAVPVEPSPPAPKPARPYDICYLMGNCSMGRGRSLYGAKGNGGTLRHAVRGATALCGQTYGRRSAGWSEHEEGASVTCPRCARKIATLARAAV